MQNTATKNGKGKQMTASGEEGETDACSHSRSNSPISRLHAVADEEGAEEEFVFPRKFFKTKRKRRRRDR